MVESFSLLLSWWSIQTFQLSNCRIMIKFRCRLSLAFFTISWVNVTVRSSFAFGNVACNVTLLTAHLRSPFKRISWENYEMIIICDCLLGTGEATIMTVNSRFSPLLVLPAISDQESEPALTGWEKKQVLLAKVLLFSVMTTVLEMLDLISLVWSPLTLLSLPRCKQRNCSMVALLCWLQLVWLSKNWWSLLCDSRGSLQLSVLPRKRREPFICSSEQSWSQLGAVAFLLATMFTSAQTTDRTLNETVCLSLCNFWMTQQQLQVKTITQQSQHETMNERTINGEFLVLTLSQFCESEVLLESVALTVCGCVAFIHKTLTTSTKPLETLWCLHSIVSCC